MHIDWAGLRNPVLAYPLWSIKDFACACRQGTFFLFFSAFEEEAERVRSRVVGVTTRDFRSFSQPVAQIDGREDGWIGMCSPDISSVPDGFCLTFNSWGDKPGRPNQLFYLTSIDLKNWSPRRPLAPNLTECTRAIDAAVAFENGRYYLFWKQDQKPRCAVGDSLDGDFRFIGDGFPGFSGAGDLAWNWNENYQLVKFDGRWRMVATTRNAAGRLVPVIYSMKDTGSADADWLEWVDGYQLEVAEECFNADHHANCPCLLDMRRLDGHFYLLYAGRNDQSGYASRGWNRLGISRSRDLVHWIPAGRRGAQ